MPVENERKYVLSVKDPNAFGRQLLTLGGHSRHLRQGYLHTGAQSSARIRDVSNDAEHLPKFTYKHLINGEIVEIENDITPEDFEKLWTKVESRIDKIRVVVPHDDLVWEVDFFLDEQVQTYLVMAEVELDEGVELPYSVPSFISDNLLYLVPRDDPRFFNTRLSDADKVRKLVKSVKSL